MNNLPTVYDHKLLFGIDRICLYIETGEIDNPYAEIIGHYDVEPYDLDCFDSVGGHYSKHDGFIVKFYPHDAFYVDDQGFAADAYECSDYLIETIAEYIEQTVQKDGGL